jgi:diguanylate cyclase (GGDEF)-like protein
MIPNGSITLSSRRVLLVEHDPSDRQLLRSWLASEMIETYEAVDIITALAACQKFQPNLILLQLRLHTWDGFELIKKLKNDPQTRSTPVIFLASMAQTAEKAKGIDMGAVDFVSKPFDSVELLARVNSALRTKALLDLLEQRAHLDGLTELGNRFALRDALPLQMAASRQKNEPLAVVIADLDHFKRVNDQFGHAAGDEVLRRLAMIFRREVSAGDFLARYGGEEFVALCPNRDLTSALDLAERIRQSISDQKITFRNQVIQMTASVGVAIFSSGEMPEPADPLERADQALYRAKAAGRNAVWFFDPGSNRPFPAALARTLLDPSVPRLNDHSPALSPTPSRESARPPEPAPVADEDPFRTIAMSASGPCPKED